MISILEGSRYRVEETSAAERRPLLGGWDRGVEYAAVRYEWDRTKAEANEQKHGVSFAEAASAFLDPLALAYVDPDHSIGEHRFITIGVSSRDRVLFVSPQDLDEERIRIIGARRATRREVNDYEEGA